MKIGFTREEATVIKNIAAKVDIHVPLNEHNVLDIPDAISLLTPIWEKIQFIPKTMCKVVVRKNETARVLIKFITGQNV